MNQKIILMFALLTPYCTYADIFKFTDPSGHVYYSDQPEHKHYKKIIKTRPESYAKTKKDIKPNISTQTKSCYELNYIYGRCAAHGFMGLPCDPEEDFVMPEHCRRGNDADRGLKDGTLSTGIKFKQ
ncbi:DUF4124 domain-containing protein [Methylicorpusculum oleiharenae]|uniref:DUF4124 domain-containing protein n=1 Tax=Methylicorpusculum oleiharenae TaxID=1338687 RepID=UPI00135A8729|nr:DUF4124 domain-containing protein [Methylicorpusculum oleiharenae]MCD2449624.1 DUF4124 domain-containing protein [Methylicorpusculum oleiharenae]